MAVDPLGDISSVLVPVDGSDGSDNALAIMCDVAHIKRAKITILYVIEVPRSLPLEADLEPEVVRGENILMRAEELADSHNVQVSTALVQARQAGQALVDEALELSVDAIVIGLNARHSGYGRTELGKLPEYVLKNAPCQVWLIGQAQIENGMANGIERG